MRAWIDLVAIALLTGALFWAGWEVFVYVVERILE